MAKSLGALSWQLSNSLCLLSGRQSLAVSSLQGEPVPVQIRVPVPYRQSPPCPSPFLAKHSNSLAGLADSLQALLSSTRPIPPD